MQRNREENPLATSLIVTIRGIYGPDVHPTSTEKVSSIC